MNRVHLHNHCHYKDTKLCHATVLCSQIEKLLKRHCSVRELTLTSIVVIVEIFYGFY